MGKAYAVSDRMTKTPVVNRKPGKWIVLRLGMGIIGEAPEGKPYPKAVREKIRDVFIPPFTMIATDREAAKKEISGRLDDLFNAWEQEKNVHGRCADRTQ